MGVVDFNDTTLSVSSYNSNVYYSQKTVTFPIAFPTNLLAIVAGAQDASGAGRHEVVILWSETKTGFNIEWQMLSNVSFPQDGKYRAYWITIGY